MKNNTDKTNYIRSIFSLLLVSAVVLGSVFTVAATVNTAFDETNALPYANKNIKVSVDISGITKIITMPKNGTVGKAVNLAGVILQDGQVTEPVVSHKVTDDMTIKVYNGKKIRITADGSTNEICVPRGKTEDILKAFGYSIGTDDIINVPRNSEITNANDIIINRVSYALESETKIIKYKRVNEASDKLELGQTKLKTEGSNGKMLLTKECKYIDGKRAGERIIKKDAVVQKVDKVTYVGTKGASKNGGTGTFTDMYGNKIAYKSVHTGSGTAYTAPAGACTATGVPAYHGGVAVNPNIIPYGSKLYIASTDGSVVYGYATAVDTGGALMDGSAIVDCFYNTYNECINFGRRDVNVYVIK